MSDVQSIKPIEYRDIPGHPGYRAGSDGSIWSSKIRTHPRLPWSNGSKWKRIKTDKCNGYLRVRPSVNGKKKAVFVHQLVLLTFVGPCPNGMETLHYDDCRSNNNLSNLRYGTRSDNISDKVRNGRISRCQGEKNGASKLTEENVRSIRAMLADGLTTEKIASMFSVSRKSISKIKNGLAWTHVA